MADAEIEVPPGASTSDMSSIDAPAEDVAPEANPVASAEHVAVDDTADSAHGTVPSTPSGQDEADSDQTKLDELIAAIDRLSERTRGDQELIGRMQSRLETLQGDQVRALLGPAVTELANLHAAFVESAGRDYERLGFDRVRKEFTLLADRLESAIDLLGAASVDAKVGDPFDSRAHQAVKQVPTGEQALDKTIAAVVRQGFTFDPGAKPALYARVQVYAYDPGLAAEQRNPAVPDASDGLDAPTAPDDDLELPFPLDPQ